MSKEIEKLQKELHAPIVDKFLSLIAVPNRVMEDKWGLPLMRHKGKDWYSLDEVRRGNYEDKRKSLTKRP